MKKTPPKASKIPDKFYFKIGEVSKIVNLPPHVLRFWENEFACIKPKRTPSGQRLYRKNDVEMIFKIKQLLHRQKFTIKGAKRALNLKADTAQAPSEGPALEEIRAELEEIRNLLK
jgi:DNA-binding transcriptional MerR regulator